MRIFRTFAVLLLSAGLLQAAGGPFLPGNAITRESVLEHINYYRGINGLGPLREDTRLDQAADDRMHDMEELSYFAHFAPDGRSPFLWMKRCDYDYQAAGENLAKGFETTQLLVDSWMESPGHRANILSPNYDDVGIAIIDGSPLGRSVGQTIVMLFGREKTEKEKSREAAAKAREDQ